MSSNRSSRVTRRRFLKDTGLTLAAAGTAPLLSAPFVSKALAADKSLSIVQWAHFVPEYDKWFDAFAKDWGAKNNVAVTVDHVPVQNIPARAAAEASAGSGHDLFGFNGSGGAHLYRKFFIDVADLVKETEKKYGKVTTIGRQLGYNPDDGSWSAFPDFYINFPGMYQKTLWGEIGMLPDTWDNLRIGGAKLKAKGHPVGMSLGHSNDPSTAWRGLLWCYGASIQDEAGKKIVLNSKGAVEATKYAAALYKEAMTSDVLSWNELEQQPVHRLRRRLLHHQPDFGLPDGTEAQQEAGRRHLRHQAAEGPGETNHGCCIRILRHLEIRQEQGSGVRVPPALFRKLAGSLQGERGLQQSVLRRPCAQADADLVERSDVDPAR